MVQKEALLSVLITLQKKYNKVDEIFNLTKEMEVALQRNDQVSFQMLMIMRQEVMTHIDRIDSTVKMLIGQMPKEIGDIIRNQMQKKEMPSESSEEKMIGETYQKTIRILEKIITIDRVMNQKMGGKESFYVKAK